MKLRFLFLMAGLLYLISNQKSYSQDRENFDFDGLVNKMTEVSGGDSAIAAIKTHVAKFVVSPLQIGGAEEIFFATYKRPDKIRFDVFNAADSLIYSQFTDGKKGWIYLPDTGVVLAHQEKTEELISWAEHWIDEWRTYRDIDLDIKYLGNVKLGERECYKMLVTDRFKTESYWYVDSKTYLMARIVHSIVEPFLGKVNGSVVEDFVEYHDVGVIFPTKLISSSSTQEMTQWTMNNVLNDSIFSIRQTDVVANSRYLRQMAEKGVYVKPPHCSNY